MIITPENDSKSAIDSKAAEAAEHTSRAPQDDPPPSYNAGPSSGALPSPSTPPPVAKATNYISLLRSNGSIKGSYAINPSMAIPTAFLPPLHEDDTEETRKNLRFESMNGSVDVNIQLVDDGTTETEETKEKRKRTTMVLCSQNGHVSVTVLSSSQTRMPIQLDVRSQNGAVTALIPRSFNGLVKLKTNHGAKVISGSLEDHTTTFSEVDGEQICFVGDFGSWNAKSADEWKGDEAVLESRNGRVKIAYADEKGRADSAKGGFWSKVFS